MRGITKPNTTVSAHICQRCLCSRGLTRTSQSLRADENSEAEIYGVGGDSGIPLPPKSSISFLNIAQIYRLPQRGKGVARGHELMRHVALEISRGDSAHNSVPLH